MKNWELVDYVEPFEEEDEFPRVAIGSESELREQLHHLRQRPPGVYQLNSPRSETLVIAMGGPFAGLHWVSPSAPKNDLTAVREKVCSDAPVVFTDQGMPENYEPKYLFPVEEVIEAVIHFFKMQRLPDWLDWCFWNDTTKQWETKLAVDRTPRQPSSVAVPSEMLQSDERVRPLGS